MASSTRIRDTDTQSTLIHGKEWRDIQSYYWGADKILARPGRKQATATEDFEFHISYL
jgi:hypothetical protein